MQLRPFARRVAERPVSTVRGETPRAQDAGGEETFVLLATFALALQWAFGAANFSRVQPPVFALLLLAIGGAALTLRRHGAARHVALLVAVGVGIGDRIHRKTFAGSDVVDATQEALRVVFSGHNPYFHVFAHSRPAGSPFPYMPGELAFYGVPYAGLHSIAHVDQAAGIGTVLVLASLAPILGYARTALATMLYATFALMANLSVDGSNENGLAFLLCAAFALFMWSDHLARRGGAPAARRAFFYGGALVFTAALLFKALAWFFAPFFLSYLFARDPQAARRYLFVVLGAAALALAPFLAPSPGGLYANVLAGFVFHHTTWGLNLWNALGDRLHGADARFAPLVSLLVVGPLFTALILRPMRNLGGAIFAGLAVLLAALLCARWTTAPYFAFASTVFILAAPLYVFEAARERVAGDRAA